MSGGMNPVVRRAAEDVASHERRHERMSALRQMEREYLAVRQMTPRDAASFLGSRDDVAAVRVQSLWRGMRVRRSIGLVRSALGEAQRARAAAAIQRTERRRRNARRQHAALRAERDSAREGLLLELPYIQKRIVDEVAQYRMLEPKSTADFTREIERTLADWAELRRRSGIKATQRQKARADAREILCSLEAAKSVDPDCAHQAIAHLRPPARRGVEAPPSAEHVRLHRAMVRLALLDADAAAKARQAAVDAARCQARGECEPAADGVRSPRAFGAPAGR